MIIFLRLKSSQIIFDLFQNAGAQFVFYHCGSFWLSRLNAGVLC